MGIRERVWNSFEGKRGKWMEVKIDLKIQKKKVVVNKICSCKEDDDVMVNVAPMRHRLKRKCKSETTEQSCDHLNLLS